MIEFLWYFNVFLLFGIHLISFLISVYGMVPHLTVVLGTLLPMLGMAKHDNMKWVFSSGEWVKEKFVQVYHNGFSNGKRQSTSAT